MDSALTIAASGMAAAAAWFGSAASNLVNSGVDGPVPATPPTQPVPLTPGNVFQATEVRQQTTQDGGVSVSLAPTLPSYRIAYDPASPFANSAGAIAQPNVDIATQMVAMIQARAAFGASLGSFKAADRMTQKLFDRLA